MHKLFILYRESFSEHREIAAEILGKNKQICEEWAHREYKTKTFLNPYSHCWPEELEKLYKPGEIKKSENYIIIDLDSAVGIENMNQENARQLMGMISKSKN